MSYYNTSAVDHLRKPEFLIDVSVNRSLYTAAHGIERASRTKKVRARTALRSTRRHFINNRPIHVKLREEFPDCLRNKKP